MYQLMLILYINHTFLVLEAGYDTLGTIVNPEPDYVYLYVIVICLMYPTLYEIRQLKKSGPWLYLADLSNWLDILHVYGGYANIFC